jgi:hypothetical protein
MHLIYIDDSKDEQLCIFSGIAVPAVEWHNVFRAIKAYRQSLFEQYGISIYYELHAYKFVKGRWNLGSKRIVHKVLRCQIFKDTLAFVGNLPEVRTFNVSFPVGREGWAFERLLNRINRTVKAWGSYALLMCDEGKEIEYTRLVRRMGAYNPIHSKFGTWQDGKPTKNLIIDRIIEDPVFKKSDWSYFIQMADFCAYSLLRQDNPTMYSLKYRLEEAFPALEPTWIKDTAPADPQHVIRYK